MKLYLCPKCLQVFSCEVEKKIFYCDNCHEKVIRNLPCHESEKITGVILNCWCEKCHIKYLAENN